MGDSVKKEIGNRLETTFHIGINWENITDHNRLGIIGKIHTFFQFITFPDFLTRFNLRNFEILKMKSLCFLTFKVLCEIF